MSVTTPELPTTSEIPAPEPELEPITPSQIVAAVRDVACRADYRHCHIYRTMTPARMHEATRVMTLLMRQHVIYRRHYRVGTGRRKHSQHMYALLDRINTVDLVIAEAWATAACLFFAPDAATDEPARRPVSHSPASGTGTRQR